MRIGLLSDVHGNEPALRAALDAIAEHGPDRVIVAGDIVGGGPFPLECVRILRDRSDVSAIRGNVDRQVIRLAGKKRKKIEKRLRKGGGKARNKAWTARQLDAEALEWLTSLPPSLTIPVANAHVLVVHGSPLHDCDYVYPSITPEELSIKLEGVHPRPRVLVTGHSHVPFAREVDGTLVINCGSAGRPVDGDSRGSYVILTMDSSTTRADVRRFAYPLDPIRDAIRERDVPGVRFASYQSGVRGRPKRSHRPD